MRTIMLTLLGAALGAQQESGHPPGPDHGPFDAILAKVVRDERIDYVTIRDEHASALEAYRQAMATVDVAALPERARLAYWFNVYNASMIAAVVDRLRADWSPAKDDYAVFKAKTVLAGGKQIALDEVEHEILRKKFKEPRLHVALVCGARSCPPILARAYRAEDLDAVLEANLRRFVNDPSRNRVDHEAKKLQLSRIFDWFKDDFGGEAGVRRLVGQHLGRDVSKYTLSYLEYDWRLNLAPPPTGFLVAASGATTISSEPHTDDVVAEVAAGEVLHARSERDGAFEVQVPGTHAKTGYVLAKHAKRL